MRAQGGSLFPAWGRELFAEHLPEKVKGALPEFRQVEKTIGVQRDKGVKQTAAKVKTAVDYPEGGEPKAEDFPGWTVPYDDLRDARLNPAGKALLGR